MKNKVLSILKNADGTISGEEISAKLNISRSAVWKHIKKLKDEGYNITSATNRGYCLEPSDIINEFEITNNLETHFIGKKIVYLPETDSTNNLAKQNSALDDGTVFIADNQTAGKGRLGRSWTSCKGGGIWLSILLKPMLMPEDVSKITLAAGLAVCRAIGCGAMIKYPNDIVIGTKKVCGILTEMSAEINRVNYVICGIGINVNIPEFKGELSQKATSLLEVTGNTFIRSDIIKKLLYEFEIIYCDFLNNGLSSIIDEYKKYCINIGREIHAVYKNTNITGICTDIKENGSIVINTGNDTVEINSGEVSIRGIYGYI